MQIDKIRWKNFKSYGNNIQELTFNPEGELALVVGANGNGKSALQNIIDFVCYGQAKSSNGKKSLLSTLPNRINNDLYTEIDFRTPSGEFNITRSLNPTKVSLKENGITYPKAGKIQDKIEEHIGFDYDTYKSFISMSINDFKNFMSLPLEDKRKLLDRLFNLQVINSISKIIKALKSENDNEAIAIDREINTLSSSMRTITESLENLKLKQNENVGNKLEELKNIVLSKKSEFDNLNTSLAAVIDKLKGKNEEVSKLKDIITKCKFEAKELNDKIEVYKGGKCPTCNSDLTDNLHSSYLDSLTERFNKVVELGKQTTANYNTEYETLSKLSESERTFDRNLTQLKTYLGSIKQQYANELAKTKEDVKDDAIVEFEKTLNQISVNKLTAENNKVSVYDKKYYYEKALEIFSENGVKQKIIKNLVKPVNAFLQENLRVLELPFNVMLDENFDAKVTHLNEEIDPETLSTGETKKVNLCIMLAYIKLIRMKRNINILFLDEIFSSVDVEGIYLLLELLKNFAKEYKLNIFLIHHSELNEAYFDSIYHITKNIFSFVHKTK